MRPARTGGTGNVRQRVSAFEGGSVRLSRPASIVSTTNASITPRGRRPGRGDQSDLTSVASSMTDTSHTPRGARPKPNSDSASANGSYSSNGNANKYPEWAPIQEVGGIQEVPVLAAATVTGKGIYVFGGMDVDGFPLNSLFLCMVSNKGAVFKEIHANNELPGRAEASIFMKGADLYIFGGRDEQEFTPDLWKYSFKTKTVDEIVCKDPPPYGAGFAFTSAADGGYLFGEGELYHLKIGSRGAEWRHVQCRGDTPQLVSGQTMSATDAELVLFGGFDSNGEPSSELWRFNITSRQWREVDPQLNGPTPRGYASSTIVNGKLYICGGSEEEIDMNPEPIHDMLVFDLAKSKWSPIKGCEEFIGDQMAHLLVHNNIMYTISGNSGISPIQRRSVPAGIAKTSQEPRSRPTSLSSNRSGKHAAPVRLDSVRETHSGEGDYTEVFEFLRRSGLSHLSGNFEKQQVDDFAFSLLKQEKFSRDMLMALGLTTVGQQLRFIAAIENE